MDAAVVIVRERDIIPAMNGFLRRLLNLDTLDSALTIAAQQYLLIEKLNAIIAAQQLEYARNTRDLIEAFFVVQQSGEDVRDSLLEGLNDLRDEVARLEEHAQ